MVRVTFVEPDGAEYPVNVPVGHTVMEAARDNGVPGIAGDCGGACSCSTCHVYVEADWMAKLPPKQEMEADMLDFAYEPDPERSRLTCQLRVSAELDGLVVYVPVSQA